MSLTGITDPALLRASHIIPWSDCSDEQRLDVHNGLLLSALWDTAFDCGLVSFADDGTVLASPQLSQRARAALDLGKASHRSARRTPGKLGASSGSRRLLIHQGADGNYIATPPCHMQ